MDDQEKCSGEREKKLQNEEEKKKKKKSKASPPGSWLLTLTPEIKTGHHILAAIAFVSIDDLE